MEHSRKLKQHLLSGVFLICSTTFITGCGYFDTGHTFSAFMGETRSVPDGDKVDFNNRHTPVLNPSNTNNPNADQSNAAPPPAPRMSASADMAPVSGRQVPLENQTRMASNNGPTTMMAPVAPVTVSSPPALPTSVVAKPIATAPKSYASADAVPAPVITSSTAFYNPSVPRAIAPMQMAQNTDNTAPIVLTKPNISVTATAANNDVPPPPRPSAVISGSDMDLSQPKPSLATVPPVPLVPTKDQNTAQYNSLVGDQGQAEHARQQLMDNSDATVMTSPQTGQLVDNPATAPAKPQGGFNHWLNNLFSSDTKKQPSGSEDFPSRPPSQATTFEQPVPPAAVATQPPAPRIVENDVSAPPAPFAPPPPAQPVAAPAAHVMAPKMLMAAPPTAPVSASAPSITSAPATSAEDLPPVHLVPPMAQPVSPVATKAASPTSSGLPDVSQLSSTPDASVNLVPPSQDSGSAQGRFLPDSRYATRRGQDADDSSN